MGDVGRLTSCIYFFQILQSKNKVFVQTRSNVSDLKIRAIFSFFQKLDFLLSSVTIIFYTELFLGLVRFLESFRKFSKLKINFPGP